MWSSRVGDDNIWQVSEFSININITLAQPYRNDELEDSVIICFQLWVLETDTRVG